MSFLRFAFPLLLTTAWALPASAQENPQEAPKPVEPKPSEPAPPSRAQQMRKLSDQVSAQQAELEEQRAAIKRLEAQLAAPPPPPLAPVTPVEASPAVAGLAKPADGDAEGRETADDPRKKILIYGYVQGQVEVDQSSEDVVGQDGRSLNQNRFLVPRARLVAEREWKFASVLLELDANNVNGPAAGLQRAEATILYRGQNNPPMPPLLSVTLGQFRVPFGEENLQSSAIRYFLERSLPSRAMFPSEIDVGLRVAGGIGWFRYQLAATNGQPLGTGNFSLQDPDSAKDVGGRLGLATKPTKWLDIDGGVSSLVGKGFHQESGAAKPQLQWADRNGDGIFQASEVTGVDAVAARPSSTFKRFAVAFDAKAKFHSPIGDTEVGGALYIGNNLDRGLYVSDPTLLGRDTRHIGYQLNVVQEFMDWFVVGFRTDFYNPDSDSSDFQNAKPVQPNDRSIRTYSPMLGLRYERRARLVFQYDIVRDSLGRDAAGIPTDLSNNRLSMRLQVNL